MKKILSFVLALVLVCNLAACGGKAPVVTEAPTTEAPTTEATEPVTEPTETEPETEPTEPEPEVPDPEELVKNALNRAVATGCYSYVSDTLYLSYITGYLAEVSTHVDAYGHGDDFIGLMKTNITENKAGEIQKQESEDKYVDGVYTYTCTDEEDVVDDTVSGSMMEKAFKSNLYYVDLAWELMDKVDVWDYGSRYYLEYSYGEDSAYDLETAICDAIGINKTLLHRAVESYEMTSAGGYGVFDKATGALVTITEHIQFDYTVQGETYSQIFDNYIHVSTNEYGTYKDITGVNGPAPEPETYATPAFYHVTGEDGQELWLLGTIHIGDSRTCYLPQEIYDAFDASDALAVEVDTEYMEKMMDEDEEFAAEMQKHYYYEDGSSISEHISEKVYEEAVAAMKRAGDYRFYMDDMTAAIWSTDLDQSIMSLGDLSYDYGVDNQMLARAYAQEKEVISLEAYEDHLSIGTGCSDRLQELLLISSLDIDVMEYLDECYEMFEMWCRGDEVELRESFVDEEDIDIEDDEIPEGFTREEIDLLEAEYEEYMIGSRNPEMMTKARDFLESGKVVFYCVGVAHVLGEDNLVDYLISQGYKVEQVVFAK